MNQDLNKVLAVLTRIGEIEHLDPARNFYQAGIDSMQGMDVMLDLESEFGITIPDDQFVRARTANDLADLVTGLRNA